MPEERSGAGARQGLSWSWELDFDALMAAIADADPSGTGSPGDGSAREGSAGGGIADDVASAEAAQGVTPGRVTATQDCQDDPEPADEADSLGPAEDVARLREVGGLGAGRDEAGSLGPAEDAARLREVGDLDAGRDEAGSLGPADDAARLREVGDLDAGRDEAGSLGPADDAARLPAGALAGRVAERLAPGPDLAAWLAMAPPAGLDDAGLAAVAGSWRRVASWAQAQELAAVAQIASRAAARDQDIGTGPDGRPARVPASAAAEVALELTMSHYGAAWWTDLAVTLAWRLAATGAALAAGMIDLTRARLIAEATAALSDQAARAVQDRILPAAGDQTTGMLRAALRRAVIAADPRGAEERRNEAERRAKVVLYPDEDHTATLAGQRLPTTHAAAAMARIKAMARALKAAGADGGIDLLCAQVYIGLLLGTLPPIPPARGAPPDDPPGPPDDPPGPPDDSPSPPDDRPLRGSGNPSAEPGQPSNRPADPHSPPSAPGNTSEPRGKPADRTRPPPRPGDIGNPPDRLGNPSDRPSRLDTAREPPLGQHGPLADDTPPPRQGSPPDDQGGSLTGHLPLRQHPPPTDEVPPLGDADAPREEDDYPCPDDGPVQAGWVSPGQDDHDDHWPTEWPGLPAVIPSAFARPGAAAHGARSAAAGTSDARAAPARPGDSRAVTAGRGDSRAADIWSGDTRPGGGRSGLLEVSLPWQVLAGLSEDPGHLGRIGPVTASQARRLAECAAGDPGAEWRIIVTTPGGTALAVTRIPRPRARRRAGVPGRDPGMGTAAGTTTGIGLVSRVTLTIPADLAAGPPNRLRASPGPADDILAQAVRAAARAAVRARAAAAADVAAGGCAHAAASPGYRPPPRLHDYITARDLTCRFPVCRQPAWRGDLDHTVPFDDGGLTCRCNLGGA
jgi:hypothetical protein